MKQSFFRSLTLAALVALGLSGCISMPKQQAFNREANAHVKNIAVLETHKNYEPQILILNHPGASFGLIGGIIAASDQASKAGKLRDIVKQAQFEPLPYFKERLDHHLGARGYTVTWPASQTETGKVQRGSFGLRKTYFNKDGVDAQLDVNFGFFGYAAAGAGASAPYRPTVTAGVRLVSADGKQNLYTDYLAYNNVFNLANAVALNADPQYSYPNFDDLEKAGPQSVEGLKLAIDAVAAEVARQL